MRGKKLFCALLAALLLTGCAQGDLKDPAETAESAAQATAAPESDAAETAAPESGDDAVDGAVTVQVSDDGVLVDGESAGAGPEGAVYTAHDIVYYEAGHDFTYGEGTAADEHTAEEAAEHTVVHIAAPGTYILSGSMSRGQIAVDLGEDAKEDPDAVVTLVLNGLDVTCSVAPAVIFYNVYECDQAGDQGDAPDLAAAGARVVIADGTENNIDGSYVARIYKSYTLNEAGTAVTDSKKLHKYDGAFYSKMSMTIAGGEAGTGVLNITAENEGLDTEMHLAINGGSVNIVSGNDGINCNEDNVSVVTVNGGSVSIRVDGDTGEGDGIDSNGWLVINGGTVIAQACSDSGDGGIDAEEAICLNGGTVIATGNMLDPITVSDPCCALFSFARRQSGGTRYALTGPDGSELMTFTAENDHTYLLMTGPALTAGEGYALYADGAPVQAVPGGGGMGGRMPGGFGPQMAGGDRQEEPPEAPDGEQPQMPEGEWPEAPDGEQPQMPDGERPEMPDGERPEMPDGERPEMPDGERPEMPDGEQPEMPDGGFGPWDGQQDQAAGELTDAFTLQPGMNQFGSAAPAA